MPPKRGRPRLVPIQPSDMPTHGGQRKTLGQILAESKLKKEARLKREAEHAASPGDASAPTDGPMVSESTTEEDVVMTDVSPVPVTTDTIGTPSQRALEGVNPNGNEARSTEPAVEKLTESAQPSRSVIGTNSALSSAPSLAPTSPGLQEILSRDQAAKLQERIECRQWKITAKATTAAESRDRINGLAWKSGTGGQNITASRPISQATSEETSAMQRILSKTGAAENLEHVKGLGWKVGTLS